MLRRFGYTPQQVDDLSVEEYEYYKLLLLETSLKREYDMNNAHKKGQE